MSQICAQYLLLISRLNSDVFAKHVELLVVSAYGISAYHPFRKCTLHPLRGRQGGGWISGSSLPLHGTYAMDNKGSSPFQHISDELVFLSRAHAESTFAIFQPKCVSYDGIIRPLATAHLIITSSMIV